MRLTKERFEYEILIVGHQSHCFVANLSQDKAALFVVIISEPSRVTTAVDMYSFGICALEVRKNLQPTLIIGFEKV
jgi:hypothetical protein